VLRIASWSSLRPHGNDKNSQKDLGGQLTVHIVTPWQKNMGKVRAVTVSTGGSAFRAMGRESPKIELLDRVVFCPSGNTRHSTSRPLGVANLLCSGGVERGERSIDGGSYAGVAER
jgi:hypothetical protein